MLERKITVVLVLMTCFMLGMVMDKIPDLGIRIPGGILFLFLLIIAWKREIK